MIRHIVFFRVSEGVPYEKRAALLKEVKSKLGELPSLIPEILSFEIGVNFAADPKSADLSLLSEFRSPEDLDLYQVHPAHQAFIEWNRGKCPKFAVVDYKF